MIKDDGSVIHFNNPKVQASLNANTFAVSGHAESKQITEMLPGIISHLGAEGFNQLKRIASSVNAGEYLSVLKSACDIISDPRRGCYIVLSMFIFFLSFFFFPPLLSGPYLRNRYSQRLQIECCLVLLSSFAL